MKTKSQFTLLLLMLLTLNAVSQNLNDVTTIATASCTVGGVAVDNFGNIYYGERGSCFTIKKIDTAGNISTYSVVNGDPYYMIFDTAYNYLYVAYHWSVQNKIVRIPNGGGAPQDYVTDIFDSYGSASLLFDGDTMYYGEYSTQRIYKVLPGGGSALGSNVIPVQNVTNGIGGPGARVYDMAWLPNDNLLVACGASLYEVDKISGASTFRMAAPLDVVGLTKTSANEYFFCAWQLHYVYKLDVVNYTYSIIAGAGTAGDQDGPVNTATFNGPYRLNSDNSDNLIIGQFNTAKVKRIWGCDVISANMQTSQACLGDTISLISNPTGGNYFTYTYQWFGINGNISTAEDTSLTLTSNYNNTYIHLTVTDLLGCTVTDSVMATAIPDNTVSLASVAGSDSQMVCINNPMVTILYTTTGATGIGASSGLPSGVTATFSSDTITITGVPTQSGVFNYSLPLSGGCGNVTVTGTINVDLCTGIAAQDQRTFSLYPNPSKGQFTILSEQGRTFELLDVSGKVIRVITIQNTQESVHVDIAPGLYFLRDVQSGSTQKLIVE
ncbi:MAG: T9SS type A sorting domain-containing protein [Bacteroidia bacterium]|nr:T9SS type A sorting domain-containing protein [Bacteroidia bacterium]